MFRLRWAPSVCAPAGEDDLLLAAGAAFGLVAARDVDGAMSVLLRSCLREPVRVVGLLVLDYYGKPRLSMSWPAQYASWMAFEAQVGSGPVLDCVRSGHPIVQARIRRRDREQYAVWARRAGCTSAAAVPIVSCGRPVGAVALLGREGLEIGTATAVAELITTIIAPQY